MVMRRVVTREVVTGVRLGVALILGSLDDLREGHPRAQRVKDVGESPGQDPLLVRGGGRRGGVMMPIDDCGCHSSAL